MKTRLIWLGIIALASVTGQVGWGDTPQPSAKNFNFSGLSSHFESVSYSPDGSRVLISGTSFGGTDRYDQPVLEIRDATTHELIQRITSIPGPIKAEFAGYNDRIMTWGPGRYTTLWFLSDVSVSKIFYDALNGVCGDLSPDGRYFAMGTASEPGRVLVYDLETGITVNNFPVHRSIVKSVSLSRNGKYVLTCGIDSTLKLWDVRTGQKVRHLEGDWELLTDAVLSDVEYAAFASDMYGKFFGWDLVAGKLTWSTAVPDSFTTDLAMSPDNNKILAGGIETLLLGRGLNTIHERFILEGEQGGRYLPQFVKYSPTGNEIVLGHQEKVVAFDVSAFKSLPPVSYETPVESPTVLPPEDLPVLVLGGMEDDALTGSPMLGKPERIYPMGDLTIRSMDVSPDGLEITAASALDGVRVWNIQNGDFSEAYEQFRYGYDSARFSKDGKYILAGSSFTLRMWDRRTRQEVLKINNSGAYAVAEALDKGIIATAGYGGQIKLWDAKAGTLLKTFAPIWEYPDYYQVDLTPDGQRILVSGSYGTALIEIQGEKVLFQGGGNRSALSPDGRFFFTGGEIRDALTGALIRSVPVRYLPGDAWLTCAAFSPDGSLVAVGTYSTVTTYTQNNDWRETIRNQVQIFDTATGQLVRATEPAAGQLFSVIFSKDGTQVFAGGNEQGLSFVRRFTVDTLPLEPTPTITPTATSTQPPAPTFTPTDTPPYYTPTPIPDISQAWQEVSPDSARGIGISDGNGNPYRLLMRADPQGKLTVAWSNFGDDGEDYTYVKQWNGTEWAALGCDPARQRSVVGGPNRLNWLTLDPLDGNPIVTMDFYSNLMRKWDGSAWTGWAGGGLDDEGGYEFFTQILYLPDGTPIALYLHGIGSGFSSFRVKKLVGGNWVEFSPGSATGNGIADSSANGYGIFGQVARNGDLYVTWLQNYTDGNHNGVYMKKWNGERWENVGSGSTEGYGIASESGWFSGKPMILDENDLPIVTYQTNETRVMVQRFDGQNWVEIGAGSNRDYGVPGPAHQGAMPVLAKNRWGWPVLFWQDYGPGFSESAIPLYAKEFNGLYWEPAGEGAASGNGIGLVYGIPNVCYSSYDSDLGPNGELYVAFNGPLPRRDIYIKKLMQEENPPVVMTPTATVAVTPTATFTPTDMPLPTSTPTPVPNVSQAWREISPGSASGDGITGGYGNPYRMVMDVDSQGQVNVAYSNIGSDREDYTYVKQWDGTVWKDLGTDPAQQRSVVGGPNRLNWLTLDPIDGNPIVTMDFYSNLMRKWDGSAWTNWAGGGIDDEVGYEFFTQILHLPDGTPLALYLSGIGSSFSTFRVKKLVDGNWVEFSPGSATGNGIADSDMTGFGPFGQVAPNGNVYVAWMSNYPDREHNGIYVKKWDGQTWTPVGLGATEGYGVVTESEPESAWLSLRPMVLDENNRPILCYYTGGGHIRVQRFDGQNWVEIGAGSNRGDGILEPGHRGVIPVLVKDRWNRPVLFWQDFSPIFREGPVPLYAKRFNGMYWEPAGEGAASGNGIGLVESQPNVGYASYDADLAPNGELHVAYNNTLPRRDIYVKKLVETETPIDVPTPTPAASPTPIKSWLVLDGFGGIHTAGTEAKGPSMPYFYPFNIVRDLEPDPLGRGWYMLDGFGGIHTDPPTLPKPTNLPYFYGFDIARELEIKVGPGGELEFYMLDGFGTVHSSTGSFDYGTLPWFGVDLAQDLDYDPKNNEWLILDSYGLLHSNKRSHFGYTQSSVWQVPLVRSYKRFVDDSVVVIDAYGGRHTDSIHPAWDVLKGLPTDFYFPGWEIIWDVEVAPEAK